MILIADSGSTKTDWIASDGKGKEATGSTDGLNPYYLEEVAIHYEIEKAARQLGNKKCSAIYFYGAGCSSEIKNNMIRRGLALHFPGAVISIESDLLGAARALCGHEPGITCILGTGSGSTVYDGQRILKSIPSLGFILGDEGSGAHLGKQLVRDFLREEMPGKLIDLVRNELAISKDSMLENVNRKPMPSRYLANFSRFIYEHIDDDYLYDLVYNSFVEFIKKYILRYPEAHDYSIHFTGSIALNFHEILNKVLSANQLRQGKIIGAPIKYLLKYHLNKQS